MITVSERGWHTEGDEPLLDLCLGEQRALMTNNVADFAQIARRWAAEGRRHPGLAFTSGTSLPRSRETIGRFVEALDELMRANHSEEALNHRVLWL